MTLRFTSAIAQAVYSYTTQLNHRVTVGQVAQYLSQAEAYLNIHTLEYAYPVSRERALEAVNMQPGDRLVVFTQPPKRVELPAPLRTGDKVVVFASEQGEVSSRGKRQLLVGKPEEVIPDIDLTQFIAPDKLDFISRNCLWLSYEDEGWTISRMGQTRVMVDQLELGETRIALNAAQTLRFYRATGEQIGTVQVRVEEVKSGEDGLQLPSGHQQVVMRVGYERENQTLNASENLVLDQIVRAAAGYNNVVLPPDYQLYLMRLAAPSTTLQALDTFLYASLSANYARSTLRLRDGDDVYNVQAGHGDQDKVIGWGRPGLDVELSKPLQIGAPPYMIHLRYDNDLWLISLDTPSHIGIYVNQTRLGDTPLPLTSGDILTIGINIEQYIVKYIVEIAT